MSEQRSLPLDEFGQLIDTPEARAAAHTLLIEVWGEMAPLLVERDECKAQAEQLARDIKRGACARCTALEDRAEAYLSELEELRALTQAQAKAIETAFAQRDEALTKEARDANG